MPKVNKNANPTTGHTPFAVVEAYNTIRTNILFVLSQHKGRSFVVSSSNPGEGKSTTALNIASSFSQLGSKILIIDGDMRKPILHKKAHIQNSKGLSSVLVGFCGIDEAIHEINPFLYLLPSGPTPPNPGELLSSEAFDELMVSLKEKFDYVIVDTPPINVVSDAVVAATRTDGIVLVARDRKTYHDDFKSTISSIEFANVKILGAVLNAIDAKETEKHKYKYKYRYRYKYRNYANSSYINNNNQ